MTWRGARCSRCWPSCRARCCSPTRWGRTRATRAPLLAAGALVGSLAVANLERAHGSAVPVPTLLAITAFGVYATVPDTEHARAVLGASIPVAVVGLVLPRARVGAVGSATAWGVIVAAVGLGGVGRSTAIVGGLACAGVLVAEPAGRLLGPRGRAIHELGLPHALAARMVAVHGSLVFVASRVAGLRAELPAASVIAVAGTGAGIVLLRLAGEFGPGRRERQRTAT